MTRDQFKNLVYFLIFSGLIIDMASTHIGLQYPTIYEANPFSRMLINKSFFLWIFVNISSSYILIRLILWADSYSIDDSEDKMERLLRFSSLLPALLFSVSHWYAGLHNIFLIIKVMEMLK